MKWDKALKHIEMENRNLEQSNGSMRELLEEILPLAMGASCFYDDHPEADRTQHCCDWSPIVERICDVLGRERPVQDGAEVSHD